MTTALNTVLDSDYSTTVQGTVKAAVKTQALNALAGHAATLASLTSMIDALNVLVNMDPTADPSDVLQQIEKAATDATTGYAELQASLDDMLTALEPMENDPKLGAATIAIEKKAKAAVAELGDVLESLLNIVDALNALKGVVTAPAPHAPGASKSTGDTTTDSDESLADSIYQAAIDQGATVARSGLGYMMSAINDLINAVMGLEITVANVTADLAQYLAEVSADQVTVINQDTATLESYQAPQRDDYKNDNDYNDAMNTYNNNVTNAQANLNADNTKFNSLTSTVQGFVQSYQQEYQALVNVVSSLLQGLPEAITSLMSNLSADLR